jgi:hypothetical protein
MLSRDADQRLCRVLRLDDPQTMGAAAGYVMHPSFERHAKARNVRIIFSRKGFDSASGGCPSPIVDGMPIPLPIPTRQPIATIHCGRDMPTR